MSDPDKRTREQKVATHTVETVETVEYRCKVCEQWYENEDEMVAVTLNATPENTGVYGVEQICQSCADSLFDYQGPTYGTVNELREELRYWTVNDIAQLGRRALRSVIPIGIAATVIGVTLAIGLTVMDTVTSKVEQSESVFRNASREVATQTGAGGLFDLFGIVFVIVIMSVVISMMQYGPRA